MQKDDRITEAGTKVDSDMQPIELPSASIEANLMLDAAFVSRCKRKFRPYEDLKIKVLILG